MKKIKMWILVITFILTLAGCGKAELEAQQQVDLEESAEILETSVPADVGTYPPCVMIDGILYKDTGYISSMAGCGTMDGEIVSAVAGTKLPSENDQSNFGSGYSYQRSSEGHVIVMIDDQRVIFRDIKKDETEIPTEVIHFTGSVKEITDDGELLVTHINTAEGFQMNDGDYYFSTENMRDEVLAGDVVEVWFNGIIQETDPAKLGCVYRIEKVD